MNCLKFNSPLNDPKKVDTMYNQATKQPSHFYNYVRIIMIEEKEFISQSCLCFVCSHSTRFYIPSSQPNKIFFYPTTRSSEIFF